MIQELDTVVLTHDIPAQGLKQGDLGAVVHRYVGGHAFEVEFINTEGKTKAVLTLNANDITPSSAANHSASKTSPAVHDYDWHIQQIILPFFHAVTLDSRGHLKQGILGDLADHLNYFDIPRDPGYH